MTHGSCRFSPERVAKARLPLPLKKSGRFPKRWRSRPPQPLFNGSKTPTPRWTAQMLTGNGCESETAAVSDEVPSSPKMVKLAATTIQSDGPEMLSSVIARLRCSPERAARATLPLCLTNFRRRPNGEARGRHSTIERLKDCQALSHGSDAHRERLRERHRGSIR